jgi:DNA-directed RNA polymerase specialized sigma subunit
VKRYLHDHSRLIRPCRSLLELREEIPTADADLTTRNGHPPTLSEVADVLQVGLDEVVEAMALEGAR